MKIYIGNLEPSILELELTNLFESIGELVSVKIIKDRYSGDSRGFGFIEFENRKDGETAISKYNGFMLKGSKLKVNEAQAKESNNRNKRWWAL